MLPLFNLFELAIGVYLAWCAITGRGKIYENEYLKKECSPEKYRKTLRLLCALAAVSLLTGCELEYAGAAPMGSWANWAMWGVNMCILLAMGIYSSRMTDRSAARKGAPTAASKGDPLRAAFVFDEERKDEKPE